MKMWTVQSDLDLHCPQKCLVSSSLREELMPSTVKPLLETTCIKRPPALRDHCSDTTTLLKINLIQPAIEDHLL